MKKLAILLILAFAVSGGVAQAATYYVSKAGNNGNSCAQARFESAPKLTIGAGLGCLAAGDTLLVRGGTYDEGIVDGVPSGNSWADKVRIAAYPTETVWMTPSTNGNGNNGRVLWLERAAAYIEFDGINLDSRNLPYSAVGVVGSANHIRMQNLEVIEGPIGGAGAIVVGSDDNEFLHITVHGGGVVGGCGTNCGSYGFYFGGDRNLIDNADIYDTATAGVQFYNGGGDSADSNILRNSRIHDITRSGDYRLWGIVVDGANNEVYNNIIYNLNYTYSSSNAGVYVFRGAGNKVFNNTIYNNNADGIYISSGTADAEVRNNIVFANSGNNFVAEGAGIAQSNNLFGIDPLFVNAYDGNFQVKADSPAVNKGVSLAIVTTDFAGVARPQGGAPDIGAYEYNGSSSTPPAAPASFRIVTQ